MHNIQFKGVTEGKVIYKNNFWLIDFEFIRFSIYTCLDQYVNAESNYSYTTKCGSEEEFKALLSEKNSIKI